MPYKLKAGKSVACNIRRIVTEEIDSAVKHLRVRDIKKRDEAIHEARKSIKKIRGVLKLMRPELGKTYGSENRTLRQIGTKLSELRDAGAVIETLQSLITNHAGKLQKNALAGIRRGLEQSKRDKERSLHVAKVMQDTVRGLLELRKRVDKWPLDSDGFAAIASGLKGSYRDGRKAMAAAHKSGSADDHHEWRKRAKDHWYHLRLLENVWSDVMKGRENGLHNLETWLGDDHNLIVLQQQLEENPERFGDGDEITLFKALAVDRQRDLRDKSSSVGQRLYEEKPKLFVRRMSELWDTWQSAPEASNKTSSK